LIQAAGDHDDTIGLVVSVRIHNGVHFADILRSDEHRALRTERHRPGVLHLLGEHVSLKSRRQRGERRRVLTGGTRQARSKHTAAENNKKRPR
jgi:hypothetical protein